MKNQRTSAIESGMKLTDLGEKKIIKYLEQFLDIGDDAAYLKLDDRYLVMSTDMICAKTHLPKEMTWKQIGKKVVTVNFSDLAAMGAEPIGFLLSYGSPDMNFEDFDGLIRAVNKQCIKYGAKFLGGDMNQTDELILAGTALGISPKPILRSGAQVNDILCVTGYLGSASLGLDVLAKSYDLKDLKDANEVLNSVLEPEPRIKEGILLRKYASAMTDISDGLATSLYDIAEPSGVGIKLHLSEIPLLNSAIKVANELNLSLMDYALYGGDDYELLFTLPEKNWKEIKGKINATKIGKITEKEGGIIGIKDGEEIKIKRGGYEHFCKKSNFLEKHGKYPETVKK